mmetsp:Transcript_13817/g.51552  ORF Transcript_13817/g.51552 Transcript_13817/m.51552 type:complete len:359 (+) Transcript_13817:2498-3574(+)
MLVDAVRDVAVGVAELHADLDGGCRRAVRAGVLLALLLRGVLVEAEPDIRVPPPEDAVAGHVRAILRPLLRLAMQGFDMQKLGFQHARLVHALHHGEDLQNIRRHELEAGAAKASGLQLAGCFRRQRDAGHVQQPREDESHVRRGRGKRDARVVGHLWPPRGGPGARVAGCSHGWRDADPEQLIAPLVRIEGALSEMLPDAVAEVFPERGALGNRGGAGDVVEEPCQQGVHLVLADALEGLQPGALQVLERILQLATDHLEQHEARQGRHGLSPRRIRVLAVVVAREDAAGTQEAHVPDVHPLVVHLLAEPLAAPFLDVPALLVGWHDAPRLDLGLRGRGGGRGGAAGVLVAQGLAGT